MRLLILPYDEQEFKDRLIKAKIGLINSDGKRTTIRGGVVEGTLLGGNLGCLLKLAGTPYFPDFEESILFLESYGFSPGVSYCNFVHLEQLGVFNKVKGIIIGHIYDENSEQRTVHVHSHVYQIILSGSRGLAGFPRKESDIDLSLLVQASVLDKSTNKEEVLEQVLRTTIDNWRSSTKIDTAAIFDVRGCRLSCFSCETRTTYSCPIGGVDCFGIYKVQKGFKGYVTGLKIEVEKVFPIFFLTIRGKI